MRPAAAPAFALVLSFVSASVLAAPCAGFNDVDDSDPFCVNVEWMKNRGITAGVTPTTYEPNSPVTRLQMAAFMYRLGFQNALLQGGNAFGAKARFGTTDAESVEIISGAQRVAFFERRLAGNVILGTAHPELPLLPGYDGITIASAHSTSSSSEPPGCGRRSKYANG